jgi:hypothetical protein
LNFGGVVTEVSANSITIQGFVSRIGGIQSSQKTERNASIFRGNPLTIMINGRMIKGITAVSTWETLTVTAASGEVTTFRRIDQPLLRFEACEELAAGKYLAVLNNREIPYTDTYRLADVRVGDVVIIASRRENGIAVCKTIRIMRRPGGQIPPTPVEPPDPRHKHHEMRQAEQDLEEKGIPIPDRFLPPWELAVRPAKIAPMPRVFIPPIPPAAP